MTREEIIEMLNWHPSHARTHGGSEGLLSRIERVVAVAVAAEREACAQVAEKMLRFYTQAVTGVPEAIRARGQE